MQVSFNPSIKYKNSPFEEFYQQQEKKPALNHSSSSGPSRDEIITARTKKAISECKFVIFALGILYFAMKRNIKVNKIRMEERKLIELSKMKVPHKDVLNINPNDLFGL